ncbi:MAG: recombinase family protein [Methylorubrum populi]
MFKRLRFAGVSIVTLSEGEINELHVGLKGTMNALFLKDLALKTHRGQRGRVEAGKAGSGRAAYGYRTVHQLDANGEPIRGERVIVEEGAKIVRRIFRGYAGGRRAKEIAFQLNREGVPGPRNRPWIDATIRGNAAAGTGILNNELYAGVLAWNQQRFIKNPETGTRVSRVSSESVWIRTEVPHLRIVDDALWQAVRERQRDISALFGPHLANTREGRAKRLHLTNRPVTLLSGLLTCGCCGVRWTDQHGDDRPLCLPQSSAQRHLRQRPHHPPRRDRGAHAGGVEGEAGIVGDCCGGRARLCQGNQPTEP